MASRVSGGLAALIVGSCVVMVAVGIGIGALVWAGDDESSDETGSPSAEVRANAAEAEAPDGDAGQDANAPQSDALDGGTEDGGSDDGGVQPNDRPVSITIYVYAWQNDKTVNISPLRDSWPNCVKDANAPGDVTVAIGDPAFGRWVPLTATATGGGVFESCSYQESRMHWALRFPDGSTYTIRLFAGVNKKPVAQCGDNDGGFFCGPGPQGAKDTLSVRIP
jgi:hypothetical protein